MEKNLEQEVNNFYSLLYFHDWYFEYSDDHSVWKRGWESSQNINRIKKDNKILQKMYDDYVSFINGNIKERPSPKNYI